MVAAVNVHEERKKRRTRYKQRGMEDGKKDRRVDGGGICMEEEKKRMEAVWRWGSGLKWAARGVIGWLSVFFSLCLFFFFFSFLFFFFSLLFLVLDRCLFLFLDWFIAQVGLRACFVQAEQLMPTRVSRKRQEASNFICTSYLMDLLPTL